MAGKKKSAILSVNIVSDANTKGFTEAARAAQKMAADINASTAQAAGMATKIGGLTTGITSLVSIAGGAIGQVAAGATALAAVVLRTSTPTKMPSTRPMAICVTSPRLVKKPNGLFL